MTACSKSTLTPVKILLAAKKSSSQKHGATEGGPRGERGLAEVGPASELGEHEVGSLGELNIIKVGQPSELNTLEVRTLSLADIEPTPNELLSLQEFVPDELGLVEAASRFEFSKSKVSPSINFMEISFLDELDPVEIRPLCEYSLTEVSSLREPRIAEIGFLDEFGPVEVGRFDKLIAKGGHRRKNKK